MGKQGIGTQLGSGDCWNNTYIWSQYNPPILTNENRLAIFYKPIDHSGTLDCTAIGIRKNGLRREENNGFVLSRFSIVILPFQVVKSKVLPISFFALKES